MGMFTTYDTIDPNYIPDNTSPKISDEYTTIEETLPRMVYDLKGRFIGYSWNYGDTFDFDIDVNEAITVREDSIIYTKSNQCPNENTPALYSGHQAYNIVDSKSWTCVGKSNGVYIWVEDDTLTYPIDGDKSVTLNTDMTDSTIQVDIFNFRWEPIHSFTTNGSGTISCKFDTEVSNKLLRGAYYCTVKVLGVDSCTLKDKYMLIVN